ncbi:MAG: 30S ribosomal protein S6 [Thermomicrobiales bacterium]
MRPYEMMIVLAPDIPEDELDPTIDTIESYVTRFGGEVIAINRDSPWGRRRLAYPIRHAGRDVRDGFYALYYFDVEPTAITEIEREIRLNDRIIRHMIIALEEQVTILPPVEAEGETEGEATAEAEAPAVAETAAPEAAEATAEEAPAEEPAAAEATEGEATEE